MNRLHRHYEHWDVERDHSRLLLELCHPDVLPMPNQYDESLISKEKKMKLTNTVHSRYFFCWMIIMVNDS